MTEVRLYGRPRIHAGLGDRQKTEVELPGGAKVCDLIASLR